MAASEFDAQRGAIASSLAIAVAQDVDADVRRLTLHNRRDAARDLDVTSYAELVLGSMAADAAHPAFSKLFVQTEWVAPGVLLARAGRAARTSRRSGLRTSRSSRRANRPTRLEYETDRARFLGRGRGLRNARALTRGRCRIPSAPCSIPCFSIRTRLRIPRGERASVAFWTLAADSREAALASCAAHATAAATDRAFAEADRFARGDVRAHRHRHRRLRTLSAARRAAGRRRSGVAVIAGRRSSAAPAAHPCCGRAGFPAIVRSCSCASPTSAASIRSRELLRSQRFWQAMRMGVDVVVLNVATAPDATALQATLDTLVGGQQALLLQDDGTRAEAFVFADHDTADALRDGLATVARIVCDAAPGSVERLPDRREASDPEALPTAPQDPLRDAAVPVETRRCTSHALLAARRKPRVRQRHRRFRQRAREYAITLADGRCTPMPWINVVANASFGFSCRPKAAVTPGRSTASRIRSRRGRTIRSAIRRTRCCTCATRTAADCGAPPRCRFACRRHVRHPPRQGLQPVRARRARDRASSCCSACRWPIRQAVATALRNRSDALRRLSRHRVRRVGARREWNRDCTVCRHRGRCGDGRAVRTQCLARRVRRARRIRRSRRRAAQRQLPIARSFSGATDASIGLPRSAIPRRCRARRRRTGSVRRAANARRARAGSRMRYRVRAGRCGRRSRPRRRWSRNTVRPMSMRCCATCSAPWDDAARHRAGAHARSRDGRHAERLAAVSDARVPGVGAHGLLSGQRRVRLSRSAAGRDGAVRRAARDRARASVARGSAAIRAKATSSTGGCRRPGQGIRTRMTDDRIWLALRRRALHRRDRRSRACSTNASRSSTATRCKDGQIDAFFHARSTRRAASLYEHCARALDVSLSLRRARPAADGHRRLERRHEPRRRQRARRKRLARLVSARDDRRVRAVTRRGAPTKRARDALARFAAALRVALENAGWDGKANGIGAAITTTARRWARATAANARSTRSHSRGA